MVTELILILAGFPALCLALIAAKYGYDWLWYQQRCWYQRRREQLRRDS